MHLLSCEILNSLQESAKDLERIRDNSSTQAWVNIILGDFNLKIKVKASSQTTGNCHSFVGVCNGVQTDD